MGAPIKAALEVTRILRDDLRSVIEFGGLTLESYIDFQNTIRGRINRLEAGPPPFRSKQLLALLDAGLVQAPFGPHPQVSAAPDGGVTIRSTDSTRSSRRRSTGSSGATWICRRWPGPARRCSIGSTPRDV